MMRGLFAGRKKVTAIITMTAAQTVTRVLTCEVQEHRHSAENVYDEKGNYLGQDLIFIFAPYSIEKNQNIYNVDQTLVSAGEKITGWFAYNLR